MLRILIQDNCLDLMVSLMNGLDPTDPATLKTETTVSGLLLDVCCSVVLRLNVEQTVFSLYLDTKTFDPEMWKKLAISIQKILHRASVAENVFVCINSVFTNGIESLGGSILCHLDRVSSFFYYMGAQSRASG